MTSQKITLRQTNESRKKTARGAKTFAMRAFSQGHRDQTALRLITKTCAPHDSLLQNTDQQQDQIRELICFNQPDLTAPRHFNRNLAPLTTTIQHMLPEKLGAPCQWL